MSILSSETQIETSLAELENWQYGNKKINKVFAFDSYMESIDFINFVAQKAEEVNHHPDLTVGYCKINIEITSHDLGGVTTGCIDLAKSIDSIR
jgi:4a-hydroxytetrahydrobiopterin dehydratase